MATIVDAINATTETITVSGLDVPVRGTNLSIDDEIVTYAGKTQDPLRPYVQQPANRWRVKRGQAGTTAASHSANATIAVKVKEYGPLPIDANAVGASDAASVTYDPTESGLDAEDVQAALDEVAADGGVINGAADTEIAVSDGTDLTGSAHLTWNAAARTLGLVATEDSSATVKALGLGTQLFVRAATGDETHVGGELTLLSGDSAGQSSGAVTIATGDDDAGGDSGPISIQTGEALTGQSGAIEIRVDPDQGSAVGGDVLISAGSGQTGDGGSVQIEAGPKVTGGDHGSVNIVEGSGTHSIFLDSTGLALAASIGFYGATPTAQPAAVANATTAVDVIPRFNELLARLRTLGIIAT